MPSRPRSTIPAAATGSPASVPKGTFRPGNASAAAATSGSSAFTTAVAEGRARVAHQEDATTRRIPERPLDHDGAGTAPGGVAGEAVAVVRVPPDGDEELTRGEGPAVGRDAGEAGHVPEPRERPAGGGEDLLEREGGAGGGSLLLLGRDHRPPASWLARARRTSSRSSRWRFS